MNRLKNLVSIIYPRLVVVTFAFQILSLVGIATFTFVRRFVYPYVIGADNTNDPAWFFAIAAGLAFLFSVPLSFLQITSYTYLRTTAVSLVRPILNIIVSILSILILLGYLLANHTNLLYELFLLITSIG